jgi:hypothetical protein
MSDMTPDELEKIAAERKGIETEEQISSAYDILAKESGVDRVSLMRRAFILVRREVTTWRRETGGGIRLVENKEGA